VEFVLTIDLQRAIEGQADLEHVRTLLARAASWRVALDTSGLGYRLRQVIERAAHQFRAQPADLALLERFEGLVDLARTPPFEVDLRDAQNVYYELLHAAWPAARGLAEAGDERAETWVGHFLALGEKLNIQVPRMKKAKGAITASAGAGNRAL
jgi:hypothetical protein